MKKDKVQVNTTHITTWVEGENTLVYKPEGLLAALVCDAVSEPIRSAAYPIYREVAKNKPTRAAALGITPEYLLKKDGTPGKRLRVDPNHARLKYARDGVLGALEFSKNSAEFTRIKYNINLLPASLAYAQRLASIYAEIAPEHYQRQFDAAQQVHPHWIVEGTPFSSATTNWCFPTFLHVEGKDYKPGLGVLTTFYVGECPDSWLVFPRYGVAVLVKAGSVLLADVGSEMHANTEIPIHPGYGETSGRLSLIHYFRPGLLKSGTPDQEAQLREAFNRRMRRARER